MESREQCEVKIFDSSFPFVFTSQNSNKEIVLLQRSVKPDSITMKGVAMVIVMMDFINSLIVANWLHFN